MSRIRRVALACIGVALSATSHHAASAQQTSADVRFMQEMIHHHAQALEMTALVPGRSESRAIDLLARRIEITQKDEIAWMRDWLERRGENVPSTDAHGSSGEVLRDEGDTHGHHGNEAADTAGAENGHAHGANTVPRMPGMLTEEQMSKLGDASGAEFDRMFLEYMMHHHEGALTMVRELFSTEGAAQETDVFTFAAEVDADQRAEIRRMQSVLDALQDGGSDR